MIVFLVILHVVISLFLILVGRAMATVWEASAPFRGRSGT